MTDTRTRVDELIEESYLVSLPEDAIRKDVLQFLESVGTTISQVRDEPTRAEMLRRLAMFKQLGLRLDTAAELNEEVDQWMAWSPHDILAHRAARLKLLVLDAIGAVDPAIADRISAERFPRPPVRTEPTPSALPRSRVLPFRKRRRLGSSVALWGWRFAYGLLVLMAIAAFAYRFLR